MSENWKLAFVPALSVCVFAYSASSTGAFALYSRSDLVNGTGTIFVKLHFLKGGRETIYFVLLSWWMYRLWMATADLSTDISGSPRQSSHLRNHQRDAALQTRENTEEQWRQGPGKLYRLSVILSIELFVLHGDRLM